MYANSLHGNREIPGVADRVPRSVRSRKASGRNLDMHAPGKSDGGIVSMKRANKGAQPGIPANHRRSSWREGLPAEGNPFSSACARHTEAKGSVERELWIRVVARPELAVMSGTRQWKGHHRVLSQTSQHYVLTYG